MRACEVEYAVAEYFGYRENLVIPNVSWGLPSLGHEADLLVIRPSNYCVEVEIKVDASDIKADLLKTHHHESKIVKQLWFAVPDKLKDHASIPEHAGVLSITEYKHNASKLRCTVHRTAKINTEVRPLTNKEVQCVLRLGCLRIWSLKQRLHKRKT